MKKQPKYPDSPPELCATAPFIAASRNILKMQTSRSQAFQILATLVEAADALNLEDLRIDFRLIQTDMAEICGVSPRTYSSLANGHRTPRLDVLRRLYKTLAR